MPVLYRHAEAQYLHILLGLKSVTGSQWHETVFSGHVQEQVQVTGILQSSEVSKHGRQ